MKKMMKRTAGMAFVVLGLTLTAVGASAHEQGKISDHSADEENLYFGFGPPWDWGNTGWSIARAAAHSSCMADGHESCTISIAAYDHCTFHGEGDFVHEEGDPKRYICISHPLVQDSDDDGVPDDVDQCSDSDLGATVVVSDEDSGIENVFFEESGCSLSDLVNTVVDECASDARNHGQNVSCVAAGLNELKKMGVLTGREHGALQSIVARSR